MSYHNGNGYPREDQEYDMEPDSGGENAYSHYHTSGGQYYQNYEQDNPQDYVTSGETWDAVSQPYAIGAQDFGHGGGYASNTPSHQLVDSQQYSQSYRHLGSEYGVPNDQYYGHDYYQQRQTPPSEYSVAATSSSLSPRRGSFENDSEYAGHDGPSPRVTPGGSTDQYVDRRARTDQFLCQHGGALDTTQEDRSRNRERVFDGIDSNFPQGTNIYQGDLNGSSNESTGNQARQHDHAPRDRRRDSRRSRHHSRRSHRES